MDALADPTTAGTFDRTKGGDRTGQVYHPLPAKLLDIHRRLKNAFDPERIFNPGKMYEGV